MKKAVPIIVDTITELNELFFLPPPKNPLITLIDLRGKKCLVPSNSNRLVFNFYSIWIKKNPDGKLGYGQKFFDFKDGSITFQAPGQIISVYDHSFSSGWALAFHLDFIQHYRLAKSIANCPFFSYSANKALSLSDHEEQTMVSLMKDAEKEWANDEDRFSQDIAVLKIETLLSYASRFYFRQTPDISNKKDDLLIRFELLLNRYFERQISLQAGLPTVKYLANELSLSAHYLGDTLKHLTGKTAQQHIHEKLIEKAKEKLSSTNLSVSEIAFELGFEHPQSFSKLFKAKTNLTPLEFKLSLN